MKPRTHSIRFLLPVLLLFLSASCSRSLELARGGQTPYSIVTAADADSLTNLAAARLQSYLRQITGAEFPVTTDATAAGDWEIVLGPTNRTAGQSEGLGQDGFVIRTEGKRLFVTGETSRGTLNGIYTLLDDYLGCRKYSATVEVIPQVDKLTIPAAIEDRQVPQIVFRDVYYRGTNDQGYVDWHKLSHDTTGGKPEWGLWVHTFERLLPPHQYFQSHPEYFAWVGNSRATTQLCLTNPEVLEIVCENLAKEIELNPSAHYWSVSTNDNFGYCRCEECARIDSIEGGPTGTVIQFVNKVAERFPDKTISTLAYQYTRSAPLVTKPLDNVNIMFCNIECNRSQPIAFDSTSASFRADMEAWGKLTSNILVWDYVIQFKNLVSPFPNFHTLQPNLQYFVNHGVNAMFEQGNREVGGEFADLRSYLLSKLMWNPHADTDSLMTDFLDGYYGPAGKYIKQYIGKVTLNLTESGKQLQIFGGPVDGADSWLSPENLAIYNGYFEQAQAAVDGLPDYFRRVRFARTPLMYAELEQAKLDPFGPNGMFVKDQQGKWITNPLFSEKLETFIALCKEEGVTRLSEWHTTPEEYLEMMSRVSIVRQEGSLSFEKPVTLSPQPHRRYNRDADKILTNGMNGSHDYTIQWLGWDTPVFEAVVDLGSEQSISSISSSYLQVLTDWIFYPKKVTYWVSDDGANYRLAGEALNPEVARSVAVGTKEFSIDIRQNGRFVKVVTEGIGTCPPWHLGAGGKAFAFMDEITVK